MSFICHGQRAIAIATRHAGRRTFSSTTILKRYGPVPKFTEVSDPELQSLFDQLRTKVIMPAHLSKKQQDLIYRSKKRHQLEVGEPVIVNLSGEQFTLEHIDKTTDLPGQKDTLRKAARLMVGKDWDNLPNLLKGLKNAGYDLNSPTRISDLRFIIMKAKEAGRMDVILECARRGEDTGMVLKKVELVQHILFHLHQKALEQDQTLSELDQTLSWAEQIAIIMEDPKHAGNIKANSPDDPRSSPLVIGILLDLAALRSSRYFDNKDDDGKVLDYARKYLGSQPLKIMTNETRNEETYLMNSIMENLPVVHGLKLALGILDPASPVAESLKQQVESVEPQLLEQKKVLSQMIQGRDVESRTLQYWNRVRESERS